MHTYTYIHIYIVSGVTGSILQFSMVIVHASWPLVQSCLVLLLFPVFLRGIICYNKVWGIKPSSLKQIFEWLVPSNPKLRNASGCYDLPRNIPEEFARIKLYSSSSYVKSYSR